MEFGNPIVGTEDLIRTAIKSPNYETGVSGWIIRQDGTAEFQDLVARGSLTATELDIDNSNENGEDRGRLHAFYDEVNINQKIRWLIGQDNIDDFIGPGSGAVQTQPAEIRHEVRGDEQPELVLTSGSFNGNGASSISIFGTDWEGGDIGGIALTPRVGGAVTIDNGGLVASRMRPETAVLGSDSTRSITDTVFTEDIDGEELSVTLDAAPSGAIEVSLWAQADITAGAGFIAFEVRANNGTGTVLQNPVDGTGIILVNLAGARITYFFQVPVEDTDFANSDLFIRAMVKTSSGGTLTIQRARLTAEILP